MPNWWREAWRLEPGFMSMCVAVVLSTAALAWYCIAHHDITCVYAVLVWLFVVLLAFLVGCNVDEELYLRRMHRGP